MPPNDGNPQNGAPPPPNGGRAMNSSETGDPGIARLFSEPLVTEASWILPLALFSILLTGFTLTAKAVATKDDSSPRSDDSPALATAGASVSRPALSLIFWTLWLIPIMAYFSFTTGLFHRYYLIMLGPALAALTGMAFWSISQLFKHNRWLGFSSLILMLLVTFGFQVVMLSEYSTAAGFCLLLSRVHWLV